MLEKHLPRDQSAAQCSHTRWQQIHPWHHGAGALSPLGFVPRSCQPWVVVVCFPPAARGLFALNPKPTDVY